eukprot:TRINITY_DN21763_c0_g1_i1.p1 TRINITY_DN21763_c0_g1~~TRINITY_DN21763_c0_g1_i1.p1  ORF type:complete len:718 (+),score=120.86 TRINITY_DN21763_c0_g1_i1:88-2241(+)
MYNKYTIVDKDREVATCNGKRFILQQESKEATQNYDLALTLCDKPTRKLTKVVEIHKYITGVNRIVYEYGAMKLSDEALLSDLRNNRTNKCLKVIADVVQGFEELAQNGLTCRLTFDTIIIDSNEKDVIKAKIGIHEGLLSSSDPSSEFIEFKKTLKNIANIRQVYERDPSEIAAFMDGIQTLEAFTSTDYYKKCLEAVDACEKHEKSILTYLEANSCHSGILSRKYPSACVASTLVRAGERGYTLHNIEGPSSTAVRVEGVISHIALATLDTVAYVCTSLDDSGTRYLAVARSNHQSRVSNHPVITFKLPPPKPNERLLAKGRWLILTSDDDFRIFTYSKDSITETCSDQRCITAMSTRKEGRELMIVWCTDEKIWWNYFPEKEDFVHGQTLQNRYNRAEEWKLKILLLLNERNQAEAVDILKMEKRWDLPTETNGIPNKKKLMCLSGDGVTTAYLAIADEQSLRLQPYPRVYKDPPFRLPCYNATSLSFTRESASCQYLSVTCENTSGGWFAYRKLMVYKLCLGAEPALIFERKIWKTQLATLPLQMSENDLSVNLIDCRSDGNDTLTLVSKQRDDATLSLTAMQKACWNSSLGGSDPTLENSPVRDVRVTVDSEGVRDLLCLVILKEYSLYVQPYDPTARRYNFPLLITRGQRTGKPLTAKVVAHYGPTTHSMVFKFQDPESHSDFYNFFERRYNITRSSHSPPQVAQMLTDPE